MKHNLLLLFLFLYSGIYIAAAALCVVLVFIFVFTLYSLPPEAVIYASVIALAIISVFVAFRFRSFKKRHDILEELDKSMPIDTALLPEAVNLIECDCFKLIRSISESRSTLISDYDRRYSDTVDYYTMWVHQIKTPISAARLLLQSSPLAESQELDEQIFKIEQYVGMVLGYLRSDSLQNDLYIKKQPVDPIVRQAVKKFSKSFIRKKIPLAYSEFAFSALTDEKWLLFVLEQIISNAIKYSRDGSIEIYPDSEYPQTIVIKDHGIGIRAEDLPRLGEKGFTGYNGREDKRSTGIGLYLCKKILAGLSHEIKIDSEIGKGTTVRMALSSDDPLYE